MLQLSLEKLRRSYRKPYSTAQNGPKALCYLVSGSKNLTLRVQSTQIHRVSMVSVLAIVIMVWAIYFIFGYLDP